MNAILKPYSRLTDAEPDTESLQRCDHALALLLMQRGHPAAEVERVLAEDPQCVFAHCLRVALIVLADNVNARSTLAASVSVIEAAYPDANDPARRHASAARAWLEGDSILALEHYGALAAERPGDILALALAHALDFRLGRRLMLRDRIAHVLPKWPATARGYASVLAMYAFGLEENGEYARAERMARRALALEPLHAGAVHVVAHVMEMEGRNHEGLAFLAANEEAWAEGTGFSVHLAWHRALFHLDANDPAAALAVYDAQIVKADASGLPALADASALLWRLKLRNFDIGERWRLLADRWETKALADARVFYIAHATMAFAAAGRTATGSRTLDMLPRIDVSGPSASVSDDAFARPFCQALLAFASGDYVACVEWLIHVRKIADRCGGSLAQCDLIHLTLTEAALRARRAPLARSLVAERSARKPTSRFNRLLQRRLRTIQAPSFSGRVIKQYGRAVIQIGDHGA
jgi:tetratricopeptide (TPR) repeat protein